MKKRLLIIALHLAASGADAYYTHRVMAAPNPFESNPLARPFVTRGTPLLITGFSAETAIEIFVPHLLRTHNHNRIALAVDLLAIGGHTYGAVTSAQGFRDVKRTEIVTIPSSLSAKPSRE